MDPCPYCGLRTVYTYVAGRNTERITTTCGYPECRRAAAAARTRAWTAAKRRARLYECQACRAAIELPVGTVSGPRTLCDDCHQIGKSVALVTQRARGAERYICPCGAEFTRPQTKGQRPRWCPACAAGRGWKKANPALRRAADARRRARAAIVTEVFAPAEIFERDRWRCGICRKAVRKSLAHPHPLSASLDHVIPLAEGGHHVRANVRLSHLRCNLSRGARGGGEQLLLIG